MTDAGETLLCKSFNNITQTDTDASMCRHNDTLNKYRNGLRFATRKEEHRDDYIFLQRHK